MADFLGTADVANSISQAINPSKAEVGQQQLAQDFQQFLTLLTTQLQNQDPTEPLDTNEFTNQLVMFASVEQQLASNLNLEELVNIQKSNGSIDASVNYIGRYIETTGNAGVLENGSAGFIYDLERSADDVDVSILDSSGRVVFSGQGSANVGKNVVVWDGINSNTGEQAAPGTYFISVAAKDAQGLDIDSTTYSTGRVTAVELNEEGRITLELGDIDVFAEDVIAIREGTTI